MTDLWWDEVKRFFDLDLMGALPDVRVPNASVADRQAVLNLVAASGWKWHYTEGDAVLPMPRAEDALSRPADAACPGLRIWPSADVQAIFRFHVANEVDFDVDLRELRGQDRLEVFCGLLRDIGRRLGKPVLMDPEGGHRAVRWSASMSKLTASSSSQTRRPAPSPAAARAAAGAASGRRRRRTRPAGPCSGVFGAF